MIPANFLRHFRRIKRRKVTERDFKDAVGNILLSPRGESRSENQEPTKNELQQGWRLARQLTRLDLLVAEW